MYKLIGAWDKLNDSRRSLVILGLLLLTALTCQLYYINRDCNGLHTYGEAQNHVQARNLARYGLSAKLGPVCNVNPLNDKFGYYLYHPFLPVWLTATFYRLFGSSIVFGRLISMFVFTLSSLCLFFVAKRLWSDGLALWACFFYLFFPASQYFYRFVGSGAVFNIFSLLFIFFYDRWAREENRRDLIRLIAFYLLASATDWPGIFLGPLAFAYHRFWLKKNTSELIWLPLAGFVFVLAFLGVNYTLTGSITAFQSQWPANLPYANTIIGENQNIIRHMMARMDFSLLWQTSYYLGILKHLFDGFTWPIVLLLGYFLCHHHKYQYSSRPTVYVLILSMPYLCYGLVHPKTLIQHSSLMPFLTTSFALACALVITKRSRIIGVLCALLFLVCAFVGTVNYYRANNSQPSHFLFGRTLSTLTKPADGLATNEPFFVPYLELCSGGKILYDVYNRERLDYLLNSNRIDYFLSSFGEFHSSLLNRYRAVFLHYENEGPGYVPILYDLRSRPAAHFKRRHDIAFSNKLRLIDFFCKKLAPDLLQLTYCWEKSGSIPAPFKVFVHLVPQGGPQFGQDYFIRGGFEDLTVSGHKLIEETYVILIPSEAAGKQLSIYVGLYFPATPWERVQVLSPTTTDNRVYLGKI